MTYTPFRISNEEADSILTRLEQERQEREAHAVILNVHGVKISTDNGNTWKVVAICTECFKEIEPPTRAKKECIAGVKKCDWCDAINAENKLNQTTLELMALKRVAGKYALIK